jgi:chemotaxis protein methyltransferase CheR
MSTSPARSFDSSGPAGSGAANSGTGAAFTADGGQVELPAELQVSMSAQEYLLFTKFVQEHAGIHLGPDKKTLLSSRLLPLLRRFDVPDFRGLYKLMTSPAGGEAIDELVDRITTHYTYFNRETEHFTLLLQRALPEATARLRSNHELDLRVWCAASSTGEEPYDLAIRLREFFGPDLWKWKAGVLATDVAPHVLEQAKRATYSEHQLSRLPPALKQNYFVRRPDGQFQVVDRVRNDVVFRRLNLMRPAYPFKRAFDIIFCRNVLLYFDEASRIGVEQRLVQSLQPGGYLFLGMTEGLVARDLGLESVDTGVYRRPLWGAR